jgi:hypothetical protein
MSRKLVLGVLLLSSATLLSEERPEIAHVNDARYRFPPSAPRVGGRAVPNLGYLRRQTRETPPVPGGIGAGTIYRQGALSVTFRAELHTQMIVYPTGINVADWIFTTATNRSEKTVEVVGIYLGQGASLGVFDWSCLPDYPCPNGSPGASWQWTRDFTDLSCYVTQGEDGAGHLHDVMSYINKSVRRGSPNLTGPAVWTNSVLLFNTCSGQWELVYRHVFRVEQRDCSADQFACGWWGPIIETFQADPQPAIPDLGFIATSLRHDNTVSLLGRAETFFSGPTTPWTLFYIDPNRSWSVGSFPPG